MDVHGGQQPPQNLNILQKAGRKIADKFAAVKEKVTDRKGQTQRDLKINQIASKVLNMYAGAKDSTEFSSTSAEIRGMSFDRTASVYEEISTLEDQIEAKINKYSSGVFKRLGQEKVTKLEAQKAKLQEVKQQAQHVRAKAYALGTGRVGQVQTVLGGDVDIQNNEQLGAKIKDLLESGRPETAVEAVRVHNELPAEQKEVFNEVLKTLNPAPFQPRSATNS